jgi:CheY-like chemotaxis protein
VILLDYRLQDMSGLDCLKIVRRSPGGSLPKITMFTADWNIFEFQEEIRALDAIITTKPCDLAHVQTVVGYLTPATPA